MVVRIFADSGGTYWKAEKECSDYRNTSFGGGIVGDWKISRCTQELKVKGPGAVRKKSFFKQTVKEVDFQADGYYNFGRNIEDI